MRSGLLVKRNLMSYSAKAKHLMTFFMLQAIKLRAKEEILPGFKKAFKQIKEIFDKTPSRPSLLFRRACRDLSTTM